MDDELKRKIENNMLKTLSPSVKEGYTSLSEEDQNKLCLIWYNAFSTERDYKENKEINNG